ncbi:MAG TPA: CBS domain-containing protein [Blastocatellia bacterium]|jgi:CBS domain-containing protein
MAYRDRDYDRRGGSELDEGRFETRRRRPESFRRFDRGYGEDYRGYSRGYNMGREPNYRTEQDRGYTGWGMGVEENYGRGYGESNRYPSSEAPRWETSRRESLRDYAGQGPSRSHLRCRDIMTRNVTTARTDTPIAEVSRLMKTEDIGAVLVLDQNGKLEGIVTDRDIVVRGLTSDKNEAELVAADCMSTDLYTANQNERLVEVIEEMGDHQVRRIPVVDGRNRLVGIISMADIALHTDKDRELAEALEDVSRPPSFLGRLANMFNW